MMANRIIGRVEWLKRGYKFSIAVIYIYTRKLSIIDRQSCTENMAETDAALSRKKRFLPSWPSLTREKAKPMSLNKCKNNAINANAARMDVTRNWRHRRFHGQRHANGKGLKLGCHCSQDCLDVVFWWANPNVSNQQFCQCYCRERNGSLQKWNESQIETIPQSTRNSYLFSNRQNSAAELRDDANRSTDNETAHSVATTVEAACKTISVGAYLFTDLNRRYPWTVHGHLKCLRMSALSGT